MSYKSFLLGFICCLTLGIIGFKAQPYIIKAPLFHYFFKTAHRIEKQKFPLLEHATYPFSLVELPYQYQELEPYLEAKTLEIHRTQHHQPALDNLNKALKDFPKLHDKTLAHLLENSNELPEQIRSAVCIFGGSHFNHTLYFSGMSPTKTILEQGVLAALITKTFGSFAQFQEKFEAAAQALVGSGWVWLCADKNNELQIIASQNHEVPFERGYFPLLILDVWEHAYYLTYQSKRLKYVQAWWHVVNWPYVEALYACALGKNSNRPKGS